MIIPETKPNEELIYTPEMLRDLLLYGETFVQLNADGTQMRIDPATVSYRKPETEES